MIFTHCDLDLGFTMPISFFLVLVRLQVTMGPWRIWGSGHAACTQWPHMEAGYCPLQQVFIVFVFFLHGVFLLSPSFPILFSKSIGYKYWQKTRYFGGDTPILSCQAEENMYETCTKKCCHQFRELRKQDWKPSISQARAKKGLLLDF